MKPLYFDSSRENPMDAKQKASIPESRFDFNRTSQDKESEHEQLYRFARGYSADPALMNAVNIALLAGKPLLITGEPGTGKTQLAYRMGWEFQMPVHKLEVKSSSEAKDLFYHFDVVGHFRSAQLKQDTPARDFITYGPLGRAIVEALGQEVVEDILPSDYKFAGPRRSIVLIDEIDKAPRDFPNDILSELEEMYFRIPELNNREVAAPKELAPIVVLTSNSEKNLPDAFLRRCVFHHISFPDKPKQLKEILRRRLDWQQGEEESVLTKQLLEIFTQARATPMIDKKPSTSEFITWVSTIADIKGGYNEQASKDLLLQSLGLLFKKQADFQLAPSFL